MPITPQNSRVVILVKALPQPSKQYGETVCCAGLTQDGEWKRLYPVRFRHLQGEQSFSRWDWVSFNYRPPTRDTRKESCHVFEDSIAVGDPFPEKERTRFLNRLILGSAKHAAERGLSLALIGPRNTRFSAKPKSAAEIEEEREAYRIAARQESFFDQKLADLEPSPYEFRFSFDDESGSHSYQNGDWEAHAMFFRERHRTSETRALEWMDVVFNEEYPRRGMVFAIGNMAKRPQTWQLLGVIRLDKNRQAELQL
jgi:hypothetical protein